MRLMRLSLLSLLAACAFAETSKQCKEHCAFKWLVGPKATANERRGAVTDPTGFVSKVLKSLNNQPCVFASLQSTLESRYISKIAALSICKCTNQCIDKNLTPLQKKQYQSILASKSKTKDWLDNPKSQLKNAERTASISQQQIQHSSVVSRAAALAQEKKEAAIRKAERLKAAAERKTARAKEAREAYLMSEKLAAESALKTGEWDLVPEQVKASLNKGPSPEDARLAKRTQAEEESDIARAKAASKAANAYLKESLAIVTDLPIDTPLKVTAGFEILRDSLAAAAKQQRYSPIYMNSSMIAVAAKKVEKMKDINHLYGFHGSPESAGSLLVGKGKSQLDMIQAAKDSLKKEYDLDVQKRMRTKAGKAGRSHLQDRREEAAHAKMKAARNKVIRELQDALRAQAAPTVERALRDAQVLAIVSGKGREECMKTEDELVKNPILQEKCRNSMWQDLVVSPFLVAKAKARLQDLKHGGTAGEEYAAAIGSHSGAELSAAIARALKGGALGGLSGAALAALSRKRVSKGAQALASSMSAGRRNAQQKQGQQGQQGRRRKRAVSVRHAPQQQRGVPRFATKMGLRVQCQGPGKGAGAEQVNIASGICPGCDYAMSAKIGDASKISCQAWLTSGPEAGLTFRRREFSVPCAKLIALTGSYSSSAAGADGQFYVTVGRSGLPDGLDLGLRGMCMNEEREVTVPPKLLVHGGKKVLPDARGQWARFKITLTQLTLAPHMAWGGR